MFLRWQLFTGALSENAYARAILGVRNYLEEEAKSRPHLGPFLAAWSAPEG
jgi:3'-5' exonuclease